MPSFVRTQEIEQRIGSHGRFALRVTSPDVEVKGTPGEVARVRIALDIRAGSEEEADELFERARYRLKQGDAFLEVAEPKRGESGTNALARIFGMGGSATVGIEAEVPRGAEVELDGVSSDVTVTGLSGAQSYRTVSGDLVLDDVSGSVRVQGVSADVSLRADEPVALDAHTVSGDLSAFAPHFPSLRVVTVSGDVELEGSLDAAQSHRVETVSGDLSIGLIGDVTLEVRGLSTDADVNLPHRAEGSRDRRRYVVGGGAPQLLFSSMSGDVSIGSARRQRRPVAPVPPIPPVPPNAPVPPTAAVPPSASSRPQPSAPDEGDQLAVLQALERGEIDVDEAARRLGAEHRDA